MSALIALILSCASVFAGATNDIRIVSTTKTNVQTGSVTITDVYTRNGQTNLVRDTKTKAGALQIRVHRFYHAGSLVGDFVAMPDSSGLTIEAGSPYGVSFEFGPSRELKSAVIGTKDGEILDAFACTNGVFYPDESSRIRKANAFMEGAKQEAEQLLDKLRDK
jgi:hypothetical protein